MSTRIDGCANAQTYQLPAVAAGCNQMRNVAADRPLLIVIHCGMGLFALHFQSVDGVYAKRKTQRATMTAHMLRPDDENSINGNAEQVQRSVRSSLVYFVQISAVNAKTEILMNSDCFK